jgi:flagellar biosynthetic protein FliR
MPGEITFSPGTLFGFLLTLARVAGVVAFLPLPGVRRTPEVTRVVLALALTFCLLPKWPASAIAAGEATLGRLTAAALTETAYGLAIGVAVSFLIESFQLGAQVFGLQAGYSYASTIDPNSEADSSVLQLLAQLIATVLFFAAGFDREVIRALAASMDPQFTAHNPLTIRSAEIVLRLGAVMFQTAMRIALPVVALLLMVDVALALLGRMQAQLQLLTVAFPAKMLTALAFLAVLVVVLPHVFESSARRTFESLARVFGG